MPRIDQNPEDETRIPSISLLGILVFLMMVAPSPIVGLVLLLAAGSLYRPSLDSSVAGGFVVPGFAWRAIRTVGTIVLTGIACVIGYYAVIFVAAVMELLTTTFG